MERRLLIAAALSLALYLGWEYLTAPPPAPPQPPVASAPAAPADETAPEVAVPSPIPPAANAVQAEVSETVLLETGLLQVEFTNRGAAVTSWKLRDYTVADGAPVELFPRTASQSPLPFSVQLDDERLTARLNEALYRVERTPLPEPTPGEEITFTWADGAGLEIRKTLTFRQGSYIVDCAVEVLDRGQPLKVSLVVGPGFSAQDPAGRSTYYYDGQALWNAEGHVTRLKKSRLTDGPGELEGKLRWAGLEDQYFTALVIPGDEVVHVRWRPVPLEQADASAEQQEPVLEPLLAVSVPPDGAQLFIGPKKFTLLRELGHELDKSVWFSSDILPGVEVEELLIDWIARHIFLALLWLHDNVVHNYGMAIVLATVLLRLLLFPVNQYAMVSMKKTQLQMQRLQPKVKAIKAKYKKAKADSESRTRMNQEMMEMYRKEGVNPMGGLSGCLPMLAQLPILLGFYNMLTVAIELRGAPLFGWIGDLSRNDPWFVLPVLMGVTMFAQQAMAMSKVKDPVQQQQQRMMLIMPVVFTVMCLGLPSGMVLYWFVNNLLGIGQQWLVNRHTARLEAAAQKA